MLKLGDYNSCNNQNKNVITRVQEIVDMLEKAREMQDCFEKPIDKLIEDGYITLAEDGFHIKKGIIKFTANYGSNFVWSSKYPLHFDTDENWANNAKIPANVYQNADIAAGDTTGITKFPSLGNSLNMFAITMGKWDTSELREMDHTFGYATGVRRLDLTNGDLGNLEKCIYAFAHMHSLETILFKEQDLPNLYDVEGMFKRTGKINSKLDLRNLRPKKILNASRMFESSGYSKIYINNWEFDPNCNFRKFAYNCSFLDYFNSVRLERSGLTPEEEKSNDGSRVCEDIIKHPEKYKARKHATVQ